MEAANATTTAAAYLKTSDIRANISIGTKSAAKDKSSF
jgi:hypothetical protein